MELCLIEVHINFGYEVYKQITNPHSKDSKHKQEKFSLTYTSLVAFNISLFSFNVRRQKQFAN